MTDFSLAQFKESFKAADDKTAALTTEFWSAIESAEGSNWSLWKCEYDYADDNEELGATKEIAASFMKNALPINENIFGVMIVLKSLEVYGLFLLKGPDPEETIFKSVEDSSWFSWSQLGPKVIDPVKAEVVAMWSSKGEYQGKEVADVQVLY